MLEPAWKGEPDAGRNHRCSASVDGLDDLVGVDALQVDRGRAEVTVAELALDDVERHAFMVELDRVRVAELVRGKAPAHPGPGGESAQHRGRRRGLPRAPAGGAVDDAETRGRRAWSGGWSAGGRVVRSPSRPCRPRGGGRLCRGAPRLIRGGGRDR